MMKLVLVLLNVVTFVQCHGGGGDGTKSRAVATMVEYDTQALKLNDSKWTAGRQWYIVEGSLTHNVLPAWSNCLRGSHDVTVGVLGDGLYHLSAEIKPNYNSAASYNLVDGTDGPKPGSLSESMGTKAAGLIAAATNEQCGVGVAYNTSIAGIRLDCSNTAGFDDRLAAALEKKLDLLDVVVVAIGWAGKAGQKSQAALKELVTKGRSGKGSVVFMPSGDGPVNGTCYEDSLVNDVSTVSLGAINRQRKPLLTSQRCGAILGAAYSEDEGSSDPMITVSGDGSCVEEFSGSVPSAAIGAGITALALQANPDLTWRDVQHLIVRTSNADVIRQPYVTNAKGRKVSDLYGFGLLDALALTTRARSWPPVPAQRACQIQATLPGDGSYNSPFTFDQAASCTGDKQISYLEHVQLTLTLTDVSDDVTVTVTSPGGTAVAAVRGVRAMERTVTTVAFWGEEAGAGNWSVGFKAEKELTGKLTALSLTVLGTAEEPGVASAGSGYVTLNVTTNACPVLGPFQIQRSMSTDFTPLYIFIVLVLVILFCLVLVTVYRRYLRKRIECRGCGPAFRQVPQNGDSPRVIDA